MSFAHLRGRVTNPAASRRTSSRRRRSRYPSSSTLSSTTSSASSTSRSSSASRRKAYSSSNATPYAPSSSSSPSRKVKVKSHRVLSASRHNHRYSPPSPPSSRPSSVSRRAAQADALLSARSGSSAGSVGSNSSSGTASHTRLGRSDPLLKYNGALKLKRDPTMRRRRRERERERELEAEREREEELLRQQRLQRYEADARVDVLPSREERRRSRTTQSRAAEEEPLPVRKVDLDSMASWQEKKARLEKQRARQLEEQRQRLRQMKNGRVAPKQEPDVPEIVDAREHVQRSLSLLKSKSRSKRIASAGRTRSGVTTEAAAGSLSRESSRLSRRQRSTSSLHRFEAAAGRGTASLTPSDSSSEEEEPPVDDVELGHSSPDSMRRSPASKRYAPASRYLTEDPLAGRPETPEEEQAPSSSGSRGSLYAIDKRARGEENPAVSPYHSRVQSEFDLPSMVSSSEYRGLVGLRNLGNTCFMNSCLQSLCCCPELLHYFDSNQYSKDINRRSPCGGRLARAFGELVAELRHGRGGAFAPYDVKKTVARIAPRFSGYGQQDVQEFLQFLLDGLHDDLNKIKVKPAYEEIKDHDDDSDEVRSQRWWRNYKERNSSFISDLFCGQLKSEVVCQRCQHKSTAFDPFWCLSVPIPKKHRRSSSFRNLLSKGSSKCTIDDCFRAFTKEELLTGNDQTYCSRCKKHRDSSKKLSIFRFPHVLVVHIKRFSSSNSSFFSFRRAKLTTDIEFPLRQLDLQEFSPNEHSGPGVYDLFAVANHSGSLGGGHYTAYGLVGEDSWANFNDSRCSRVSSSSIRGPAAYLLFYRRRPWKKAQRSNM